MLYSARSRVSYRLAVSLLKVRDIKREYSRYRPAPGGGCCQPTTGSEPLGQGTVSAAVGLELVTKAVAPYLHNGSVPTWFLLLSSASERPTTSYNNVDSLILCTSDMHTLPSTVRISKPIVRNVRTTAI